MKTNRAMSNLEIAKLLRSVAAAIGLSEGENTRFRIVAYERAADAIEHASSEVKDLWDNNELKTLSGVGEGIAASLDELFKTGQVKHFEKILKPFPPALFELLQIPGVGPKRALKIVTELGISKAHSAISQLEKAAKKGRIRELEGMGEDTEKAILQGITEYQGRSKRIQLDVAQTIADSIIAWLEKSPYVKQANTLGSLRRQVSTIGDVDLSVASDYPKEVMEHFKKYPQKSRVLEAGEHSASLILPNDYQVDLMVQPEAAYGSLLQHFTGSKHHNVALREYALKKGWSLSEYGIRKVSRHPERSEGSSLDSSPAERGQNDRSLIKFDSEEKFYNFLGLDWIPPELREDKGEIQMAAKHQLPLLVELKDIKGDLQMHSSFNVEPSHDLGRDTLEDLVKQAMKLNYQYIGVTDHNPSMNNHSTQQIVEIVKKRREKIEHINTTSKLTVLNSFEIDLQPDGKRAMPDQAIYLLDYACVSIHSSFRQDRKTTTARVLRGLDHPKVKFWAHPTARLLGEREGVDIDWDQIFDFCVKNDKWLEIDGWPNRLDLPDTLVHEAIAHGVKIVVDTDAHAAEHLNMMRYGISVARRGWATKADIINTCDLQSLKKLLP